MVKYENILKVISDYTTKCPTIAEMKEKLNGLTYDEQYVQLVEQGFMNPLEREDWLYLKERLDDIEDIATRHDIYKDKYFKLYGKEKDNVEKQLFNYARRLVEGHNPKVREPPQIDRDSFKKDNYNYNELYNAEIGDIELDQIHRQQEKMPLDFRFDGKSYVGEEAEKKRAMDRYFSGDFNQINKRIKSFNYLNKLDKEQKKDVHLIDGLMRRSPSLAQDTVLYRSGSIDPKLNVGDHSKGFKGYQSTSFQKFGADDFFNDGNMKITIYAPKGTKGIVGNDMQFMNGWNEHEFVLPRNTGYTLLSIDYENRTCEILLDKP